MNLNSIFDTLIYGKGTSKRGDYHFTLSVKHVGTENGKEIIERNYFITYKGVTVLVIQEKGVKYDFEKNVLYRMSNSVLTNRNKFSPLINKTLDRITSYLTEPYSTYKSKYTV